jgi:hypothetical protein
MNVRFRLTEDIIDCKATLHVSLENSTEPAFPDVQLTCDARAGQKDVDIRYVALSLPSGLFWRVSFAGV